MKNELLRYCAEWKEHRSRYALRHYAEHLYEAKEYETLFELARDKEFRKTQAEEILDEPNLPLETLQTALKAAGEIDDAREMAEFSLAHARQVIEIMRESPLEALRKGSLKRALDLADLYDIERCVKWYLLLAWELKDEGRTHELKKTLARLTKKELPREKSDDRESLFLLMQILEINESVFRHLWKGLLGDGGKEELSGFLIKENHLSHAIEIVRTIRGENLLSNVSGVMRDIAIAQTRLGDIGAALESARSIEFSYHKAASDRGTALAEIAAAQARAGDMDAAFGVAHEIEDGSARCAAFAEIAAVQALLGEKRQARHTFDVAVETAEALENELDRASAWGVIAAAQARDKEEEWSRDALVAALETAKAIEDDADRGSALKRICKAVSAAQGENEDKEQARNAFAAALEIAQSIRDELAHASVLKTIATAQAEIGDTDAALETARTIIGFGELCLSALKAIAIAQAQAGKKEQARATLATAVETAWKMKDKDSCVFGLPDIAIAQAQIGEKEDARATLATATAIEASDIEASETSYLGLALTSSEWDLWDMEENPDMEGNVAIAQARIGEAEEARTTFAASIEGGQRMKHEHNPSETLTEIAKIQAQAGERKQAESTFIMALETAKAIKDDYDRSSALTKIAVAQARVGDTEAAFETVRHIEDDDDKNAMHTLEDIAEAQAQAGNIEAAFETIDRIKVKKDSWNRMMTLMHVSVAHAWAGDTDAALETALSTDCYSHASALARISAVQILSGDTATAFESLRRIEDKKRRADALCDICLALEDPADGTSSVLSALSMLEHSREAAEYCKQEAEAHTQEGDENEAFESTRRMKYYQMSSERFRYKMIAAAQARVKDSDDATGTARNIRTESEQVRDLVETATKHARVGDLAAAIDTARSIEFDFSRAEALRIISESQFEAGDRKGCLETLAAALDITRGIEDIPSRVASLAGIATAQAMFGEREESLKSFSSALEAVQCEKPPCRSRMLTHLIAEAQVKAGFPEQALEILKEVVAGRKWHLPNISEFSIETDDKENFKHQIIPCAYDLDAAYRMCGLLARLCPEQAGDIAELLTPDKRG